MVKSIISALVAVAMLAGLSLYEQSVITGGFNELKTMLVSVYDKIDGDTAVKDDVLSVQKFWISKKEKLHIFIPHNDIKELDLWISEAVTLVENGKKEDAISKIDVAIELCEQIPKTFLPRVENIL